MSVIAKTPELWVFSEQEEDRAGSSAILLSPELDPGATLGRQEGQHAMHRRVTTRLNTSRPRRS